jgi:hypothetical protein
MELVVSVPVGTGLNQWKYSWPPVQWTRCNTLWYVVKYPATTCVDLSIPRANRATKMLAVPLTFVHWLQTNHAAKAQQVVLTRSLCERFCDDLNVFISKYFDDYLWKLWDFIWKEIRVFRIQRLYELRITVFVKGKETNGRRKNENRQFFDD